MIAYCRARGTRAIIGQMMTENVKMRGTWPATSASPNA